MNGFQFSANAPNTPQINGPRLHLSAAIFFQFPAVHDLQWCRQLLNSCVIAAVAFL